MSSQESSNLIGFRKDGVHQNQKRALLGIFDRNFEIFPDPVQVNQDPQDHLTTAEHLSLARNIQS